MRLIDADALNDILIQKQYSAQSMGILYTEYPNMMGIVAKQPTIEAAPVVHGRWVLVKPRRTGRNATYKCTACGQLRSSYYNDVTQWKHCPCGARMDGDGKAPTTNHRVCKRCNTAVIGMDEYAECPECGHPFEEDANG